MMGGTLSCKEEAHLDVFAQRAPDDMDDRASHIRSICKGAWKDRIKCALRYWFIRHALCTCGLMAYQGRPRSTSGSARLDLINHSPTTCGTVALEHKLDVLKITPTPVKKMGKRLCLTLYYGRP